MRSCGEHRWDVRIGRISLPTTQRIAGNPRCGTSVNAVMLGERPGQGSLSVAAAQHVKTLAGEGAACAQRSGSAHVAHPGLRGSQQFARLRSTVGIQRGQQRPVPVSSGLRRSSEMGTEVEKELYAFSDIVYHQRMTTVFLSRAVTHCVTDSKFIAEHAQQPQARASVGQMSLIGLGRDREGGRHGSADRADTGADRTLAAAAPPTTPAALPRRGMPPLQGQETAHEPELLGRHRGRSLPSLRRKGLVPTTVLQIALILDTITWWASSARRERVEDQLAPSCRFPQYCLRCTGRDTVQATTSPGAGNELAR